MRSIIYLSLCCGLACCAALACEGNSDDTDADASDTSADVDASEPARTTVTLAGEPAALDILWVIDGSNSMCEEQLALTDAFGGFVDALRVQTPIDLRTAVVSMDMECTQASGVTSPVSGRFSQGAAAAFPPGCQQRRPWPCTTNADCAGLDCTLFGACDAQGDWACRKAQNASCVENPNGSLNTTCRRACTADAECQQLFGDPRYVCQKLSRSPSDWGCILPPSTADCPASLPPVLGGDDLAQFPCIATIGVNQAACWTHEQGMRSAAVALMPAGPNAASIACAPADEAAGKCRRFLRPEAALLVAFISTEDDCSSVADIPEEERDRCMLLADETAGGPLMAVSKVSEALKSAKSAPSQVHVAVVAGDALAGSTYTPKVGSVMGKPYCEDIYAELAAGNLSEVEAARECYLESVGSEFICHHTSTTCDGPTGPARWGQRYQQLVAGFGDNGTFENICAPEAIPSALGRVAAKFASTPMRYCVPATVADAAAVQVTLERADGTTSSLTQGAGADGYSVVIDAPECDGQPNITLNTAAPAGAKLQVSYPAPAI
ncbi:MAG: hypothetical protein R3F39_18465 [Myxococcota bacterium]